MNDRMVKYFISRKPCVMNLISQQFNYSLNSGSIILKKINATRNFLAEKSNNGTEDMKWIVRFLYCPRCGLRTPNSEILTYFKGHCPSCGCRMIEEGPLPHSSNNQNDHIEKSSLNRNFKFQKNMLI